MTRRCVRSLAFLLRANGIEVQTHESGTVFLAGVPHLKAGCVITDVRMPEISGIELLRRLQELKIFLPVIVITGHGDVPLAVEAMKFGAADFLEKPFDDEILLAAVRSALNRHDSEGKRQAERAAIDDRLAALSNREREVLEGLVAGRANKQIAFDLGISPRTVEIYRANLMTKMQAASLSDLVRMALIAGILSSACQVRRRPRPNEGCLIMGEPQLRHIKAVASRFGALLGLRAPESPKSQAQAHGKTKRDLSAAGPVVIVGDDDVAVRNSLEFSLEVEGFVVRAYPGGTELLGDTELPVAAAAWWSIRTCPG